jgi:two-component system nitrate/nitrite response regulator NarL
MSQQKSDFEKSHLSFPKLGPRTACARRFGTPKFSTNADPEQVLPSLKTELQTSTLISIATSFLSRGGSMNNENAASAGVSIRILLADSKPMESQLLAGSLRHRGYEVSTCACEVAPVLEQVESQKVDVVVLNSAPNVAGIPDLGPLRTLHLTHPQIPKVFLMDIESRELAVQAFRSGARGLFCLAYSSFQAFCECIERLHRGEIFASSQQLGYLLDSVCQVPSLRVLSANGEKLLTSREEQVVALVADGLSNRDVATELGLSEHTVKKYLFRIFEKLGISSRVELVLYAVHHGTPQQLSWVTAS